MEQPECHYKLNEIRLETIDDMGVKMQAVMCPGAHFSKVRGPEKCLW